MAFEFLVATAYPAHKKSDRLEPQALKAIADIHSLRSLPRQRKPFPVIQTGIASELMTYAQAKDAGVLVISQLVLGIDVRGVQRSALT